MAPFFRYLPFAALVAGCTSVSDGGEYAPVTDQLRSEFASVETAGSQYGSFVAATLAQNDSEFDASARYYLQALKVDPDSKFVADKAFFQLLYAGQVDGAAAIAVDVATGSDEARADDLVSILYVLEAFKRGDWPEVRVRLARAEMAGFGGLMSPLLEAWSHVAEGDFAAAERSLSPMMVDGRLKPIADEHRAYMLDHLQNYEQAQDQYLLLANAAQPVSLQPFVSYAHMLARTGRIAEARSFMGKQAKRFDNNRFLLREGRLIAAGRNPSQTSANPRGAVGGMFNRLAGEFSRGSSPQAAVIYLRIASYLTPEVADIYFMLGNLMDQMGNPHAAAQVYASVPASSLLRPAADERLINALRRADRTGEAEDMLRNALRDNPNNSSYLTSLGDIMRERSEFAEAILYYTQAIDLNSRAARPDWFVYFARAVSHEQMDNWPKAEEDFLRSLELSPKEPSVLNYLGYSWIDRGMNVTKAKGLIEQAVAQRPEDGFIVDSLGWVNFLTGDYDEAVKLLEKAVRMEPDDVTINHHLGDAYWRVGRRIEARFQWQHAIDNKAEGDELTQLIDKLDMGLPEES